jgi:hypothetical protein
VRFATLKSVNTSETVRVKREVSKEQECKAEVGLSSEKVVSDRRRYLPPISANNLFSRLLKALITLKRSEHFIDFYSETAKVVVKNLISF